MRLYEITNEFQRFLEALENGEIPEEAISDTLESITGLIEEKADNIACIIKNLSAEKEAIKAEEDRLSERRKTKENEIKRLKKYLTDELLKVGRTEIETARNKISFRKSQKVFVDNEAEFIEWARKHNDDLLTYKEPTINRTAIGNALKSGMKIDGARLEESQNLQLK